MGNTCLILDCSDGRYNSLHLGSTGAHTITLPGIVLKILDDREAESVLADVAVMVQLKGITQIRLLSHGECGAYGLRYVDAIPSGQLEADVEKAAERLRNHFPGLTVESYVVRKEGGIWRFDVAPWTRR